MLRIRALPWALSVSLLAGTTWLAPALAQPAAGAAQAPASDDLTRVDFIAAMDGEFRSRDADNNGYFTRVELVKFERGLAQATALNQNRQLFMQLDTDKNGVVSPNEFAVLVSEPPLPDVMPQMKRFDQNSDRKVTIVEHRAATLANFDKLDTDFNGIVTGAEMKAGKVPTASSSGR
ncbi:MAG: hypothetical protein P8J20_07255 [Novosphingobium sp.]|nr:hypothetical protein [Novosphingobium sp.]